MPSSLCTSARLTTGRTSISFAPMRSSAKSIPWSGWTCGKTSPSRGHPAAWQHLRHLSFEHGEVDNANYTSSIRHQPSSEFTRTDPFQSFLDRDLAWQQLGRSVHDSSYLALTMPVARLRRRQVYAILYCQGFVDGLPLQS